MSMLRARGWPGWSSRPVSLVAAGAWGAVAGGGGRRRAGAGRAADQAEIDRAEREGLTSDEREELRQLRRENARLRQEREILKRAAAFFAKETETR
jgi:hypothetical protein